MFFNDQMQNATKSVDEIQPKREATDFQEDLCHPPPDYSATSRPSFADQVPRFSDSRPDSRITGKLNKFSFFISILWEYM